MRALSRFIWKRFAAGRAGYDGPAVFHITHWKAGSQWIYAVLRGAQPRRVVPPQTGIRHVLDAELHRGLIYPCVYLTREAFEKLDVPADHRKFIVIRDLRDSLVSLYFSLRDSHPQITDQHREARKTLKYLTIEEGLLHLIETRLRNSAAVQMSWLGCGHPIVRYEEMIADEQASFERIFRSCEIDLSEERRRAAVAANTFERRAGRKRGEEDTHSHFRRGIAGDWRNHFTDRVKEAFKKRFRDVLAATGYERDDSW